MEQLEYNLLFRWFVSLNMDEPVWVPTVFSKNRDRLLEGDVAEKFFDGVLRQAREADLLSDEHFSVDVFRLSWKWKERSTVKITERTREETTKALHRRREGRRLEAAFAGTGDGLPAL